ncbi:MAG: hypothetical protein Q8O92_11475 [Candidatus Latescibacter sp.]|nr:hypothetical protein [Candidatus Latescibacter sp.]
MNASSARREVRRKFDRPKRAVAAADTIKERVGRCHAELVAASRER